jgi:tetratricopeptide (TPR) repeat protein
MVDDGTAPTDPVVIERVCRGQSHAEGYTDSRGYFSIQLFQPNNGVLQDASEDTAYRTMIGGVGVGGGQSPANSPLGGGSAAAQERLLLDCELRAKASGFRSQSIMLANRRPLDPPDVGVILLHRNSGSEEGSTVSAVSLAAPKDAHKAYTKGLELLKKGKTGDALVNFEKAVEVYPNYAAAWYEVGRIELEAADNAAAGHAFEMAVKADPKFIPPYVELSVVELRAKKWKELAEVTDKVIQLDSFDYPQAYYYNAAANYYLKNLDKAEKSAKEADRLDSRHEIPKNLHLLGIILAQRGDYSAAAEKFRAYLQIAPNADDAETVRKQLAQVETAVAQAKEPH